MKSACPAWSWCRLLLLAISSYLAVTAFGLGFPVFSPTPSNGDELAYPWGTGLIFSAITAFVFLLCIDNPLQRRAAFAAFGIAMLLTGPAYVWNAERLARFAPQSSPWIAPHLPLSLTLLCWGTSVALFIWWRRRPIPLDARSYKAGLLFSGLLLILLVAPFVTNLCGIESMRILTALPVNADAFRQNKDTLYHFLIQGEAGSVGDVCGFLVQWIGLSLPALILVFVGSGLRTGETKKGILDSSACPFPSRADLLPLLLLILGGLLFALNSSTFENLTNQFKEVEHTMERHIYPHHAGLWAVQILTGLVFLAGSWLVLCRIQTAPQLRFGFTLLVLIASAALSVLAMPTSDHVMQVGGILALILCIMQIFVFLRPKRRAVWTSSVFATPDKTALSFAIEGSVTFAVLASALMALAVELAFISVFAIKYFIMWGTALKPLHGVAPTDKIVPMIAPSLALVTIVLGPVYFAFCLLICVTAVLLFSLAYSGGQGCMKFYRYKVKALNRSLPAAATTDLTERHLGEVQ